MLTGIAVPTGKLRRALKRTGIVLMITALLVFNLALPTMAAITIGSSTNANSGSGFTVTIDKPGGTVAGDVLVACIVATTAYTGGPDVTAPDGWQLIRSTSAYQGWYYKMATYYKVAGASEPAAYSWTSTYWNTSGGISRLTGVDINRVVDVSADAQGQGDSAAIATAPSVTTNFANDIVINFFGSYSPLSTPYFAEQAGLNPLYEYAPPKSGSYDPPSVAAYNWTMTSAGSTGAKTCTLTSGINPVRWVTQTVAFKAAPRAYFPVASGSTAEADTSHWVGVTLAPNAQGPVEINFTVSGTAQPGKDYTMITSSPLTVNTGSGSASIGFNIIEDGLYEADETIIITLLDGQGYFLSGNTQYTYTITNDDTPAPTPVIAAGNSTTGVSPNTGGTWPIPESAQLIQISKPTGTDAGDFLLAAISWQSTSDESIPTPAGWTLIRSNYTNGIRLATFYKIAGAADATVSLYTFYLPVTNTMAGWHATGGITRYTGVDLVTPIDVSGATSGYVNNGGAISAPSVYPHYPNSRVIAVFGTADPAQSISTPTDMAERFKVHYHTNEGNGYSNIWPDIKLCDMNWLPATATGLKTATYTADELPLIAKGTNWVAQTIALKTSQLSISDASVAEGNSSSANVAVTVSLDHPTNVPVTFSWLTADGTALAGSDYMVSGGSNYTIPAGQTSYELIIPIYGDTTLESNETFYVNLTNVTGATVVDNKGAVTILNDDSSITINDVSQNEGNAGTTNFNFTVTLSPACSLPVTVTYFTPNEGTATQSTDYYYTPGTVEIPAGKTTATISIPVIGDTDFEPNETFVVYLSGVTNAKITDNRGTGTILNDDVQIPTLSINDVSKAEGNSGTSNMVFTVTLSAASASNVSVNYATANGTAVAGSDYTLTTGTLNIPAGQTTGTISVPIIGDTTYEPNETFSVNLSSPTNATILDGTGIGTITNDDVLTMSINDVSLAEGNSGVTNFVFTVSLNGASSSPVTVDYATANGTAVAGPDYNGYAVATLTFNPGETSTTITVQVNGDTTYEADETFYVNLSNASGAVITDAQGLGMILNDDVLPTYALIMAVSPAGSGSATDQTGASPYAASAVVNISASPAPGYHFVNWTAPAGSFADANAASTSFTMPEQAVTVTANFALDTFTVSFDSQGGSTVSDQTVAQGGLVAKPANPLRSGYTFAGWYIDAACTDDWDFAVDTVTADITLYARWAVLDQILDSTGLSFMSGTDTYAQTFTAGISGGLYKASCFLYNQSAITLTTQIQGVTADGMPNGIVLASNTISVPAVPSYGAARWIDATFTEPVPITAGQCYAIVWIGLTLEANTSLQHAGTDDYAGGKALRFFVSTWLDYTKPDFVFRTYVLTSPGITLTPADGLVTTETGGTDSFTVVLDSQPAADVTITLSSSDTTEGIVSPASLTFTAANWNTPQTVTITGVDDDLSDGDISYTITVTAASADLSYHGMMASANATNTDVEGTAPVVSADPANRNITYGDNTSFSAAATGIPSPTVQWQVSTDGGSSFTNIIDGGVYSGSTATTLNLTRPPVAYSGYQYRAVFTNGFVPEATTSAAALNVTALNITGSFTTGNKVYDGATGAVVLSRSLNDVLAGDVVNLTGGTAAFADKHVGTGKTVTLTGATLSGTDAGNYNLISVANATADITPKLVSPSIVANDKTYDGTTAATLSSQTISGVLGSDDVSLIVGSATFADADVGTWTVTAASLSLSGADAGNYKLTEKTATDTAEITAKNLTISGAVAGNKTYDGTTSATVNFSGASLAGVLGTDSVSIDSTAYTAAFSDKNVGTNKAVSVLGVALSGADAANYTVSQPVGLTADITRLNITGSFTAADKVYDGATGAVVLSRTLPGMLPGDVVSLIGGTAAFADKHVGTGKTVTLTGATLSGTDAGNYNLISVTNATADITPKLVSPSIVANDKTYDGTTAATLSSQTISGVLGSDDVSLVVGSATFADADVGTWTVTAATLSLSGADAGNYKLTEKTATDTAEITAKNLTISGTVAGNKTYDGTTSATVNFSGASLAGVLGTDSVSIDSTAYTAAFSDKNVGTNKAVSVLGIALSGADAANYTVSQPVGLTADITRLNITGSFTAADKVYDGATGAVVLSRTLPGMLPGDAVSLTGGTAAFADKHVGTGKTVTLTGATLSGTDAGNYNLISVANDTADITVRPIVVTAVADTKVYDGKTASNGLPIITSATGLVAGDSANWSQTFDTKDAGTGKLLTPAGTINDGNGGNNYAVTFVSIHTGVIEKAKLTVTAEDKTSQYSDPRLAFTAVISGFIPGETLATCGVTGSPSYTTSPALGDPITQAPGNYAIIPAVGTLAANNYSFIFVNGTYTVTKEAAVITFDMQNQVSVKVITSGGGNAAFTWQARITQSNDGNPGNLACINKSNITLTFSAVGSGGGWTGTATAFDPETGLATFEIPAGVLDVETYAAKVTVISSCYLVSPAEEVLVIYDPSLGFTTGGGWFYWPEVTTNPELAGAKTTFGFTMKYNKKGTGVQGSFLLIAHLDDGSIIRIKSNAIYGLAIIQSTYPGIASFSGKCVYSRVDADGNVLVEAGNQDFTVYVQDMNEPGSETDLFWFNTNLTIAGEAQLSLDSNSNSKVDGTEYVPLGGGNIVVPHKTSSADTGEEPAPPSKPRKK